MVDDRVREKANHVRAELRALARRLRNGDDSRLVVWVIPGELGVAHRPLRFHPVFGGRGKLLPKEATPEVIGWVKRIIDQGFRAIICLMHPKEVALYARLDLGARELIDFYRKSGFEVRHVPWEDPAGRRGSAGYSFPEELTRIRAEALQAFDELPKPVLLHCSAGIDRSSPVAAYIWVNRANEE